MPGKYREDGLLPVIESFLADISQDGHRRDNKHLQNIFELMLPAVENRPVLPDADRDRIL